MARRSNRNVKKEELERLRKEKEAQTRKGMAFMMAAILIVGVLGALIYYNLSPSQEGYQPTIPIVVPQGDQDNIVTDFSIPVSEVSTNAKFYTYDSSGVTVRFFLAEGPDGDIHLATDACDVCYDNKRGYRQDGDVMTCNNCGQSFGVNGIGTTNIAGGCWPSYIPLDIVGDNVIIKNADLDGKRYMFS